MTDTTLAAFGDTIADGMRRDGQCQLEERLAHPKRRDGDCDASASVPKPGFSTSSLHAASHESPPWQQTPIDQVLK